METPFTLIQQADTDQKAIIQVNGINFFSARPADRKDANQINQVVEDLTGVEIATLQL